MINSVSDALAMLVGFAAAARLPVWVVLAATVGLEIFVASFIHDNLTLNIIMLIYPLESIRQWQMP